MAGEPPVYKEDGHWLGNKIMGGANIFSELLPKNTGPVRESFVDHSEALWEYTMTNLVYGSMASYCVFYLLK